MADEAPTPYNSRRLLNRTGAGVALGMVTLFGLAIVLLYFIEIPEKNNNVLLVLLGSLATAVAAIVQWFFGGSMGSAARKADPAPVAGTATMTASVTASAPTDKPTIPQSET